MFGNLPLHCFVFQVVEEACTNILPNVLCEYLYALSEKFTSFYSECKVYTYTFWETLQQFHWAPLSFSTRLCMGVNFWQDMNLTSNLRAWFSVGLNSRTHLTCRVCGSNLYSSFLKVCFVLLKLCGYFVPNHLKVKMICFILQT